MDFKHLSQHPDLYNEVVAHMESLILTAFRAPMTTTRHKLTEIDFETADKQRRTIYYMCDEAIPKGTVFRLTTLDIDPIWLFNPDELILVQMMCMNATFILWQPSQTQ